jgi:hypothetical protein
MEMCVCVREGVKFNEDSWDVYKFPSKPYNLTLIRKLETIFFSLFWSISLSAKTQQLRHLDIITKEKLFPSAFDENTKE